MRNLKTKSIANFIGIAVLAIAAYLNYSFQAEATTEPVLEAGQFITTELAVSQNLKDETLFSEQAILDILNQEGTKGLRIYEGAEGLVLVGTDAEGNDVFGLTAAFGLKNVGGISMLNLSEETNLAEL